MGQRLLRKVKWRLMVWASTDSIDVKPFHDVKMKGMVAAHSYLDAQWNELKAWVWPGVDGAHLSRSCQLHVRMGTASSSL